MKKGFTLVELLTVIAILGILSIIVVPNVIKYFNDSALGLIKSQEKSAADAAYLLVTDYCTNSLNDSYVCPSTYAIENNNQKYVCLSDIYNLGYMNNVNYKGSSCEGMVIFTKDVRGKYTQTQTYLYCGKDSNGNYSYRTSNSVSIKSACSS